MIIIAFLPGFRTGINNEQNGLNGVILNCGCIDKTRKSGTRVAQEKRWEFHVRKKSKTGLVTPMGGMCAFSGAFEPMARWRYLEFLLLAECGISDGNGIK